MADLAQIAQSGIDPISGSYLSAERRKALFKRSQISSNIFGGGGALVPISKKSDPETLAIVKSQSSSITSVQQQVNTLSITSVQQQVNTLSSEVANLNQVIFVQTQTVNGVQELVGSLRGEVTGFNASLNNVAQAINTDSVLEQNRVKKENEEQRRATELKLREGRESLLEKAIQNALIAPVQAIAQKTQSILSRLAQFFGTLLLGWLTNQGIETLRGLSEDNGKKIEEIRDNVLKALGIGAATLFLLNGGFIAIAATITNLSLKIGGWLLKNTVGRFFGALGTAGAALLGIGKQKPPTAAAGAGGSARSTIGRIGRGLLGPFAQGTVGTIADIAMGEDPGRALAGAAGGVIAAAPSAAVGGLLGPIGSFAAGIAGYSVGSGFGKDIYDKFFGKPQTTKSNKQSDTPSDTSSTVISTPQSPVIPPTTPPPSSPAASTVEPQSPAIPPPSAEMVKNFEMAWKNKDNPLARGRIEGAWEKMSPEQKQQAQSWAASKGYDWNKMRLSAPPAVAVSSEVNIKPLPAQTDSISTQVNVGPAPAPAPNVIYRRVGSSAQQQSSGAAPTGGPVNEVPSISASNPDNFYVLYSQVNYNVVT